MLFLTTVKVFLRSVSFKALMVLKGFTNRERLGTKLELRAWAPESRSALSPQVTCQRLVAERRSAILIPQRGKETWIYQIGNLISFRSVPYHDYAFGLLKVNRISFSIL